MLKLFERLPHSITVDGKTYRCDFDFRNVLQFLEIMQRDDIAPRARDYLCCKCLCKPPKNASRLYNALCSMLFPKADKTSDKRLVSYEQDAGLIRTAFRQVYGINLYKARLHWFEFVELLQYMPDGNRYDETVSIRARPIPSPTKYNAKEREWLLKAKQSVALHLTKREAERKYNSDVGKIFSGMMSMIKKDVNNNGQ